MNIELLELMPKEPYRGILPFRLLDWRIFFEREAETERLTNLVSLYRGVLLYGQSGAGKSSLLNAGLIPRALWQGRAPERIRVYPESGKELFVEPISLQESNGPDHSGSKLPPYLPSRFTSADTGARIRLSCGEFEEILHAGSDLGVPLLIFDQFEELVTLFEENPKDKEHFEEARAARVQIERMLHRLLVSEPLPVKLVFAFRDDYLARLMLLFSRIPNLKDQGVRLALPEIDLLHHLVRGPFLPSVERGIKPGQFGDELSEDLALKIQHGIRISQPSGVLNLSEVQTLCLVLWRQPKLRDELLRVTDTSGVLRRIIESEAMAKLNQLRLWDRARTIAVLSNLVTEDGTRNVVSQQMLVSQTRRNPLLWIFRGDWGKFLDRLPNTGLVRRSLSSGTTGTAYYYELASESLVPRIQKWQRQLRTRRLMILGCICAVLVAVPWYEAHRAKVASREAIKAKQAADDVMTFMADKVTNTLRDAGQVNMAEESNTMVVDYYNKYPPKPHDVDAMTAKGWALLQKGNLCSWKGQFSKALEQFSAGADIFRTLAQRSNRFECKLAVCLSYQQIGNMQLAKGDSARALASYGESQAVTEKLIKEDSSGESGNVLQPFLAGIFEKIGSVQMNRGKLGDALANYLKGRESLQGAIKENISRFSQTYLSSNLERIGNVHFARVNLADALATYETGLATATSLADMDFTNVLSQRDVASKLGKIGDVLRDQGDPSGALKKYNESLAIGQRLARQDPNEPYWQSLVSDGLEKIGNVLRTQGSRESALNNYRDSLVMRQALENLSPWWRNDLCSSYEKIADVLLDQRNVEEALENYRESQKRREELTKLDPANAGWQSDLSRSYDKIGDVFRLQGNLDAALKNYQDAISIRERLVSLDNSNARYQADLAYSYFHVGITRASVEPSRKQEAQAIMEKGRDILRDLKKRNSLTAEQNGWLAEIESEFGKAKKER
jgi:tetratricopeptide (TPR) repeat protein